MDINKIRDEIYDLDVEAKNADREAKNRKRKLAQKKRELEKAIVKEFQARENIGPVWGKLFLPIFFNDTLLKEELKDDESFSYINKYLNLQRKKNIKNIDKKYSLRFVVIIDTNAKLLKIEVSKKDQKHNPLLAQLKLLKEEEYPSELARFIAAESESFSLLKNHYEIKIFSNLSKQKEEMEEKMKELLSQSLAQPSTAQRRVEEIRRERDAERIRGLRDLLAQPEVLPQRANETFQQMVDRMRRLREDDMFNRNLTERPHPDRNEQQRVLEQRMQEYENLQQERRVRQTNEQRERFRQMLREVNERNREIPEEDRTEDDAARVVAQRDEQMNRFERIREERNIEEEEIQEEDRPMRYVRPTRDL